jgi:sterol desaturase/sphingolipid hydroxylase (fatty acid hydroxylase superfamily)
VSAIREHGRSPARRLDIVAYTVLVGFGVYLALLTALLWWLETAPRDAIFHWFGRTLGPADVVHRLVRRGLVLCLLLPALMVVELAIVGWSDSSLRQLAVRRTRSARSDLAVFLYWLTPGHTVASTAFSLGVVLIPAPWLHQKLAEAMGVSIELGSWPLPLQVIAFYFVFSFFDYWQHRLDHTPAFWPIHRFHHAAEDFCVLTSVRVHPAVLTSIISCVIPGVLLGMTDAGFFWFLSLNLMIHYLIHTRINSDFGWVGRWLIQSPLHHRQHHKLDMTEPTSNYSLVPLWDRMFGTWAAANDPRLPIGVARPYRHGLWIIPDLLRDYRDFWLALTGRSRDEAAPERPPER